MVGFIGRRAIIVCVFAFIGCQSKEPERGDIVRPVKTHIVTSGDATHTRILPGRVEAANKAELAFQVSGPIVSLPVKEGQQVKKGDLIAQIRKVDFESRLNALKAELDRARANLRALESGVRPEQQRQLESQLRAAQAQLVNARAEFERSRQLVRTGATSRSQFDANEANYKIAQEQVKAAQEAIEKGSVARSEDIEAKEAAVRGLESQVVEAAQALKDTTMSAPFDGVIAQRFAEENQTVQAKQRIVKFQDVDEIDIVLDVPETVMVADLRTADVVRMNAGFTAAPGLEFPVYIREVAQRADPVTQTFKVRVGMRAPPNISLLPGMTGTVTIEYRRANVLGNQILVPISAVSKASNGEQVIWIVGTDQKVSKRPVKLGEARGNQIEVIDGLQAGERIAVAGVTFLHDGMRVRDLGDALGGDR